MGSYATFEVSGYLVGETKNTVINVLMNNFRNDNKLVYLDEDEYQNVIYKMKSSEYAKILEINGFGLNQAINDFFNTLKNEIIEEEYLDENKSQFISLITAEQLLTAIRVIIEYNIYDYEFCSESLENINVENDIKLIIEILLTTKTYDMSGLSAFFSDVRYLVQMLSYCSNYSGEVIYNVSELVSAGWFAEDYDFVSYSINSGRQKNKNDKIIVLTEGKTDSYVLSESLKILYPYLKDNYYFLDFEEYNLTGGISDLIKMIKSFAAAGISNRIVAIFDNDTAAHDVINSFNKSMVPDNICIITYPELEHAKSYPTIGPTGMQEMNINGMACSIELYLGDSIIKEDGSYIPIQWTGYIKSMERYQGEITKKSEIIKRFRKLITDKEYLQKEHDWNGIISILESIFEVYKNY